MFSEAHRRCASRSTTRSPRAGRSWACPARRRKCAPTRPKRSSPIRKKASTRSEWGRHADEPAAQARLTTWPASPARALGPGASPVRAARRDAARRAVTAAQATHIPSSFGMISLRNSSSERSASGRLIVPKKRYAIEVIDPQRADLALDLRQHRLRAAADQRALAHRVLEARGGGNVEALGEIALRVAALEKRQVRVMMRRRGLCDGARLRVRLGHDDLPPDADGGAAAELRAADAPARRAWPARSHKHRCSPSRAPSGRW